MEIYYDAVMAAGRAAGELAADIGGPRQQLHDVGTTPAGSGFELDGALSMLCDDIDGNLSVYQERGDDVGTRLYESGRAAAQVELTNTRLGGNLMTRIES